MNKIEVCKEQKKIIKALQDGKSWYYHNGELAIGNQPAMTTDGERLYHRGKHIPAGSKEFFIYTS